MKCPLFKNLPIDKRGLPFSLNEEKVRTTSFDLHNTKCRESTRHLCLTSRTNNTKEERVALSRQQRRS